MLDVLHELNSRFIPLFYIIANIFFGGITVEQLFVAGIQTKHGDVVFVHQHEVLIALLHEGNVGLDQSRLYLVVALTRFGIECLDEVQRIHH